MSAVAALGRMWSLSADRLAERLDGLTDEEYFWQPVPGCWVVKQVDGAWTYDYAWPPPSPAPVTTLGWRLVHLGAANWIYWEHAFGPGQRMFPDLAVPATAADALRNWHDSRAPISAWLSTASDADLKEECPSHMGGTTTVGEVITTLLDEQIHHGAEIALLRDLYSSK